ncbi:MAG: hypothetical protein RLZZ165_1888, partial [Bacteroidota bacterium]
FEVMTQKMPDLHIGWLWRGHSNDKQDPGSNLGRAIPYYQKVIDLLGSDPEKIAKYKTHYITALRYFGVYHTLVKKSCAEAKPFWQKILDLDPADSGAKNGMEFCNQKGK